MTLRRWFAAVALVLTLAAPLQASAAAPPAPEAPLPGGPAAMAAALERAHAGLAGASRAWRGGAVTALRRPTPEPVTLWALYDQRLVRRLREDGALARRTLPLVPASRRAELRSLVAAGRELAALAAATPPSRHALRLGPARPAGVLLAYYAEAERRFGVPWTVLAAVNLVESQFGRLRSASSAEAQGPMQFIPATWRAYGLGGDVHDPHDAILGAANYLRASGAPGNLRTALFHYNGSRAYVDAVLRYAAVLRSDSDTFLALHGWQVYVRRAGEVRRVTGPGTAVPSVR